MIYPSSDRKDIENKQAEEFFNESLFAEERFHNSYARLSRELGFPGLLFNEADNVEHKRWFDELNVELGQIEKIQGEWFGSGLPQKWKEYEKEQKSIEEYFQQADQAYQEAENRYRKAENSYRQKVEAHQKAEEKFQRVKEAYRYNAEIYLKELKSEHRKKIDDRRKIEINAQKKVEARQKEAEICKERVEIFQKRAKAHQKLIIAYQKSIYQKAEDTYRKELSGAIGRLFAKLSHLSGHPVSKLAEHFDIPQSVFPES